MKNTYMQLLDQFLRLNTENSLPTKNVRILITLRDMESLILIV